MIKLGRYGVDYKGDPEAYVRQYVEEGYRAIYAPELKPGDPAIKALVKAVADAGLVIGEAGAWRNLVAHDEAKRRANLQYAVDTLAAADEMGVVACVAFHGTVGHAGDPWQLSDNYDYGPHPDNLGEAGFQRMIDTARYVIDTVKPKRTRFSLEMVPWLITGTPQEYHRLILAVDRPQFAAHIDAANMITSPQFYFDTPRMLREGFALLAPYVVSAHAKDIVMQGGPGRISFHMDEVPPGEGMLDYRAYLRELNALGRDVPLMLEHFDKPEYDRGRDHIRKVGREIEVEV
ncbi:MAG TPA: sugar phosphate isomerase/epimerase [Devosia sp.]|nr:sugar phosphate isomerase/epimerase [Devosia sp.]